MRRRWNRRMTAARRCTTQPANGRFDTRMRNQPRVSISTGPIELPDPARPSNGGLSHPGVKEFAVPANLGLESLASATAHDGYFDVRRRLVQLAAVSHVSMYKGHTQPPTRPSSEGPPQSRMVGLRPDPGSLAPSAMTGMPTHPRHTWWSATGGAFQSGHSRCQVRVTTAVVVQGDAVIVTTGSGA